MGNISALNRINIIMTDTKDTRNGWNEYSRLVLHELEAHSNELKEIRIELGNTRNDLTMLKVKASIWGLVAGSIPGLIALLISMIK